MDLDLGGSQLVVVVAALATSAAWLVAAGAVFVARRPPEPPVGPRTLELGAEPPAVANFLVNDFRVTDDAVPATLVDLAARNVVDIEQRGPGVFYVRLREASDETLTRYERRVLDHLRERALDGVVPAEALTTGPQQESARWRRGFVTAVVDDAQARGLSRDAVAGSMFTVLTAAAFVPALLAWVAWELGAGAAVIAGSFALLGWIRQRHPQRETPAGMEAASRWLGVRAELAENPVFETHSPLEVELWDRLLAYGAALGVAAGASRPLPMGVESDTHAWSAHGGRWRPVRIAYPRFFPPGWGVDPVRALLVASAVSLGFTIFLYVLGTELLEAGLFGALPFAVACLGVIVGVAVVVMAAADYRTADEVTGPILRLRAFGDDDKRHYVAIDDGSSPALRAFRVSAREYAGLEQGEEVTMRITRRLGCVRWIVPASSL